MPRSSLETARKARRQFRDVKRQLRKRQREGEESDSEEDVMPDKEAQARWRLAGRSASHGTYDMMMYNM